MKTKRTGGRMEPAPRRRGPEPFVPDFARDFDPPLDTGIALAVMVLRAEGVETFESCEGGPGHAYPDPTVRFHGHAEEGYRALSVAMKAGLRVSELSRVWPVIDGEPTGPYWQLTFVGATR